MNIETAARFAIEKAGRKAIELIKNRIQSQGKSSNDSPFSPYSTDYATHRKRNSKQVNYKDFTFSGGMFASFKVLQVDFSNNIATVTMGMDSEKYKKIAGSHSNREGGLIIAPSDSEKRQIVELFMNEFIKNVSI